MNIPEQIIEVEQRLLSLQKEKEVLFRQLTELREQLHKKDAMSLGIPVIDKTPVTPEEKIDLFLKLFRCRSDVYPRMWENQGKCIKGYSPVCADEWINGICQKPNVKCSNCKNSDFLPLDETAIKDHLTGKQIVGTYAINADDTCAFLACDFDEASWQSDVMNYKRVATEFGIDVAIERSRSGNGAHAWIFFSEPVPARIARQLGALLITKASAINHNMSLNSYDRFFPSQDFIPKGGFGNLIALPLQKKARDKDNSVFIGDDFNSHQDQWAYLASVRRLSTTDV